MRILINLIKLTSSISLTVAEPGLDRRVVIVEHGYANDELTALRHKDLATRLLQCVANNV
jgi:hypothetical protein